MWSPIKDIDGTPTDVNADATSPNGNHNEEKSEQLVCSDAVQQETDEREMPTIQEVVLESEMEISSVPVEDDFPVDEGPLVKNKPSKRRQKKRSKKDDSDKEQRNAPWTVAEEIALCKAWVNTSEDIARGNAKKAPGFWTLVLQSLDKEMGVSGIRTYDSINCKWKGLRGKVSHFCSVYDNVVRMNEGESNEMVLQKAINEYHDEYGLHFTLLHAWRHLKDNKKWKEVELPIIRGQGRLGKKSKSTSFNTSESVHFVQETRPVGVDKAKKKAASSFVPSASSDEPLVDMLPEKWTKSETSFLDRKNGEWDVFLELKTQEIELKKREIALREKEFEFLQDKQCQKDELFYTTPHDHLRGKQLEIVLEMKGKIKAKYNLDY
nr:hypothetical protein [Tanacetum cinerariifolium]